MIAARGGTPTPCPRRHALGHAYRWGTTPTPAPVTLTVEDAALEDAAPEEAAPESAATPPSDSLAPAAAWRSARRRGARPVLWLGLALSLAASLALTLVASPSGSCVGIGATHAAMAWTAAKVAFDRPIAESRSRTSALVVSPPASVSPSLRQQQPIDGGVLLAPTLLSDDGSYDLVVHFHGHAAAVEQSVAYAGLGAALAVLNLGRGAGVYRRPFERDGAFEQLLGQVEEAVARTTTLATHVRRIALSSHSAGCGAVDAILARHLTDPRIDAVLISDGIYAEFTDPAHRAIDTPSLAAFARAARRAAAGELLFSISHSMIDPYDAAGPARTARYLLVQAGGRVEPQAMLPVPTPAMLEAVELRVPAAHRLLPVHDSRIGELRVRGYQGTEREDHEAQLLQMAATVLPDLVERWAPR